LLFKERRPFKLKKEYPSEQWQIISFRLITLKTPVSFRWTVPLSYGFASVIYITGPQTLYSRRGKYFYCLNIVLLRCLTQLEMITLASIR
jgi:hypothetical protein